jgi:hypothetical protein
MSARLEVAINEKPHTSREKVLDGANVSPVGSLVQGIAASRALSAGWVGASLNCH